MFADMFDEWGRPSIQVIREESIPRDQTVVMPGRFPPTLLANPFMVIELKHTMNGGQHVDTEAWFAEIDAEIRRRIDEQAKAALKRLREAA